MKNYNKSLARASRHREPNTHKVLPPFLFEEAVKIALRKSVDFLLQPSHRLFLEGGFLLVCNFLGVSPLGLLVCLAIGALGGWLMSKTL